jgi:hypothetical protein
LPGGKAVTAADPVGRDGVWAVAAGRAAVPGTCGAMGSPGERLAGWGSVAGRWTRVVPFGTESTPVGAMPGGYRSGLALPGAICNGG